MLRTKVVSVVHERDFTAMDCTAGCANSNTINYHNPDLLSLVPSMIVEMQTLVTNSDTAQADHEHGSKDFTHTVAL